MNINSLLDSGHQVQLVITAADLKEAFMAWSENNSTEEWLPTSVVTNKYGVCKLIILEDVIPQVEYHLRDKQINIDLLIPSFAEIIAKFLILGMGCSTNQFVNLLQELPPVEFIFIY